MLALAFVSWWYGAGWKLVVQNVQRRLQKTLAMFSVPTLARTLFAPWKRIMTLPGASLNDRLHAIGDNMVSRAVGFTVRFFVLIAAALSLFLILSIGFLQILLWPLVPVAIVLAFIRGLV